MANTKAKKVLRGAGAALGVVLAAALGFAAYVQVDGVPRYDAPAPDLRVAARTPEQVARGAKLATTLCAGCHENAETKAFTGKVLTDLPPEFGVIASKNITQHPTRGIGQWTDGELRTFLRTGLRPDGQYVPPYMPKLPHTSEDDLDGIIAFLRSPDPRVQSSEAAPPVTSQPSFLVKALTHTVFKPLPLPKAPIVAPPKSDPVAYGRYLTVSLDCHGCHSADFTKVNVLEPEKSAGYLGGGNEMKGARGEVIYTANLTADDETGIGKWSEADFIRAVRQGFRPDGRVLHYPMEMRPELEDEEVAAIYAYLRGVPKIRNAVPRPRTEGAPLAGMAEPTGEAKEGARIYRARGCVACHGETGKGALADLRSANVTYPTDPELRRWIDDAPTLKPGTKMPGWKGVLEEKEYAPLIAYVRVLSAAQVERAASHP